MSGTEAKPLVSVIIPVYNRKDSVWKTMDNIRQNKYRPLELILVDDESTDGVGSVLREFCELHSEEDFKIKVLSQEHAGANAARNLGYRNASGTYIQFLDSDDFIDTEKFEVQTALMREEQAQFGLCDFTMHYADSDTVKHYSNAAKLNRVLDATESFGCGAPLLHRSLTDKIVWNERLQKKQDVDYFLRAALLANKIAHIERSLYTYIRDASDAGRISASYSTSRPVYGTRVASLRATEVPEGKKMAKHKALASLYWHWLKHGIKNILKR